MPTNKQVNNLDVLKETLAKDLPNNKKQIELEKLLIFEDRSDNLVWLPYSENSLILKSKKKALDFAEDILKKTKIPQDMCFITSDFLVAISLSILTKMFVKISLTGKKFSYTSLVRSIADHFISQISWKQLELEKKSKEDKETPSLKNKQIEEINMKAAVRLAAKFVDHLEPAGIVLIKHETSLTGNKKKSFKTKKTVTLTDQWFNLARKERERLTILPMIYKPADWSLKSYTGEIRLIGGGYLRNKNVTNLTTSLLEASDKIFKTYHSEISKENINYLQSTPYKINLRLLEIVKSNLQNIPKYKETFDLIGSKTREEYCGILDKFNADKALVFDKAKLTLEQIDYTLKLIDILKNNCLYFPLSHDGRGRLYPMSYPIATTSSNYVRSLIECVEPYQFSNKKDPKSWNSFLNMLCSRLDVTVKNFKKNPNRYLDKLNKGPVEDFSLYTLIDLYKQRESYTCALIGFDVVASGLQIMSLMCKSYKGLILTNVFESEFESGETEDIYYVIQKNVIKKCPIMRLMTRKEYKAIIMKMSYGESAYSRADDIKNYFNRIAFVKKYKEKCMKPLGFSNEEIEVEIPSNLQIAKMYNESIDIEFPEFKLFKEHFNYIIMTRSELNLPINFKVSPIYQTSQYYNLDKATTYSYRGFKNESKRIKMYIPKTNNPDDPIQKRFDAIPDKRKTLRASLPNLVHHIDSWILQEVITEFRKELRPVFTIHDAFYCRLVDVHFTKKVYFNALKKVQQAEPWKKLLISNKIDEDESQNNSNSIKSIKLKKKEKNSILNFNSTLDTMLDEIPESKPFGNMSDNILK